VTIYEGKEGDALDWIVWRHYGRCRSEELAAVLAENPGLASSPRLTEDSQVRLPDLAGVPADPAPARNWLLQ